MSASKAKEGAKKAAAKKTDFKKAAPKKAGKSATRQQFGALPYRETKEGAFEILLLTTRQTHRWIIPKGWPIKGLKPAETAAREAYEEAGLRGAMGGKPVGSYTYCKKLEDKGRAIPCEVRVYPLHVRRQETDWPEKAERETGWFAPEAAVAAVTEPALKALLAAFTAQWEKSRKPD